MIQRGLREMAESRKEIRHHRNKPGSKHSRLLTLVLSNVAAKASSISISGGGIGVGDDVTEGGSASGGEPCEEVIGVSGRTVQLKESKLLARSTLPRTS
jgi:hypothetical protein